MKILEMTLRERQVKISAGSTSRHAVGEERGKACHKEGCWSGILQACCRRGQGRGMP